MDLSKAFDFIPHNLLIGKMRTYGFATDVLLFVYIYIYIKMQTECEDKEKCLPVSVFQILLSEIPQCSILGSLLFNIFIY